MNLHYPKQLLRVSNTLNSAKGKVKLFLMRCSKVMRMVTGKKILFLLFFLSDIGLFEKPQVMKGAHCATPIIKHVPRVLS